MCHVCPINFVCKEKRIRMTKTIVFAIVMVKPNYTGTWKQAKYDGHGN